MGKYDEATSGVKNGSAYSKGFPLYYDPDAISWGGLCFAWAMASVSESEPDRRGVYNDTVFNVGDKKGLMTALYDGIKYTTYSFSDPTVFHQVIDEYIKVKKVPVVMDLGGEGDAYGEVWNYPVYKYDISSHTASGWTNYKVTLYFADDMVDPDYIGTKVLSRSYTYAFRIDNGVVLESQWTGATIDRNPKNCRVPFGGPTPTNSSLQVATVRSIAQTDDDKFQGNTALNTAVPLTNGDFTLLALSQDYFTVDLRNGDALRIDLKSEDDRPPVTLDIFAHDNEKVATITSNDKLTFNPAYDGIFSIRVSAGDYSLEPVYWLSARLDLPHSAFLAGFTGGAWANELAITSPTRKANNRIIVSLTEMNGKVKTSGSVSQEGVFLRGNVDGQPFFLDKIGTESILRIDSDTNFSASLTTNDNTGNTMRGSTEIRKSDLSGQVVFPYIANSSKWKTSPWLFNTSSTVETILVETVDAAGAGLGFTNISMEPGAVMSMSPAVLDMESNGVVSISAKALSQNPCLGGYLKYDYNPSSFWGATGAIVKATGIEQASKTAYIPHLASGFGWYTGIAVMNLGDSNDTLVMKVFDSQGNLLDTQERDIAARQTLANEVSGFFPGILPETMASMMISTQDGSPITSIVEYMTTDFKRFAGVEGSPSSQTSPSLVLPFTGTQDDEFLGLGVMNTGASKDTITVSLKDALGNTASQYSVTLNPKQRMAVVLDDFFAMAPISAFQGYITIDAKNKAPLTGTYMTGRQQFLSGGSIR
ncbi:MAG: hypothetical protein V1793_07785 [Pseudomonadota bacterium]